MKVLTLLFLTALSVACARKAAEPAPAGDPADSAVADAVKALVAARGWTCWQLVRPGAPAAGAPRHYAVGRGAGDDGFDAVELVVTTSCDAAGANCAAIVTPRPVGDGETAPALDESKC